MQNSVQILKEEREEIQELFERLNSLNSFVGTLAEAELDIDEQNWLYEKLIKDKTDTTIKYNDWWTKMCKKYGINAQEIEKYYVDFVENLIVMRQH